MSLEAKEEGQQERVPVESSSTTATTGTSRSERKRQRERKRRSELSNAFDELASFVIRMDPVPGDADHDMASRKKRTKSSERENDHGVSQIDIVVRTLKLLKRLHKENEECKRVLGTIQSRETHQHSLIENRTFSPTGTPWNREHERNYAPAYYHHPGYHPSYSPHHHSFAGYNYHQGSKPAYDTPPDTGPPRGRSRADLHDDHRYWTDEWGRQHHHDHHHAF